MSTNNESWASSLHNGLVAPDRKPAPVSTGMVTKSLAHAQVQDMRHDRFEVVDHGNRHPRLKFNDKKRYGNHRVVSFMPQE